MSRQKSAYTKERLNVWILPNQARDLEMARVELKKSKTKIVIEALALYFNTLRKQGVL